jgi:exopolysaccharide biosynthesis predicted pyruvyltransferase EpsI/glycosyltransferase involved in cell wall biosynthesis
MHDENATHARNERGLSIMRDIFLRLLNDMGVKLSRDDAALLHSQTHVNVEDVFKAKNVLDRLDLLLKQIFYANGEGKFYRVDALFRVLHLQWARQLLHLEYRFPYDAQDTLEIYKKKSLFGRPRFYRSKLLDVSDPPLISVVMPCHNSEAYIPESLWSILDQTCGDFELLIIIEADQADRTTEIISLFHDVRVKTLQNTGKPGLAQSLRFGVNAARGKYIARMDADDIAFPERFEKQIKYFEEHSDVSLCGAGQQYFGSEDRIHQPPGEHERIKAGLLFKCDLCHTTIMFDRNDFVSRDLLYDPDHPQEDYELWHRAVWELKFANIPEVLGLYRKSDGGVTAAKIDRLNDAEALIIADTLKRLQIDVLPSDLILLHGWINPFERCKGAERSALLAREKSLLINIWEQNEKLLLYDRQALADALGERWRWAAGEDGSSWCDETVMTGVDANRVPGASIPPPKKRGLKSRIKRMLWPFYRIVKRYTVDAVNRNIEDARWAAHRHTEEVRDDIRDARLATHQRTEEIKGYLREVLDSLALQRDSVDAIRAKLNAHSDALAGLKQIVVSTAEKAETDLLQTADSLARTFDKRIWTAEENLLQTFDGRIQRAEENLLQTFDGRIWKAEENIMRTVGGLTQIFDERIWKAEENLLQTFDGRICNAEENLRQTFDGRIWKTEESILRTVDGLTQTLDDRIWKAEENLLQTFDGRIRKAEENLLQTLDGRIWKAEENLLQTFDGRIWKAENHIVRNLNEHAVRYYVTRKKSVLIGTPAHDNIGDHAIAQGEYEFIRRYFPEFELYEINGDQMGEGYDFLQTIVNRDDYIFLCGGGNMGDMYLHEEEIRRRVIEDFPRNKIVILPQTIYFSDTETGRKELTTSAGIYNRHADLTIFTRGAESLAFAEKHFTSGRCFDAPDMAVLLTADYGFERDGVLVCIRDLDDESGLDKASHKEIERVCTSFDGAYEKTTNIYREYIPINLRGAVVNEELKRFARHRAVVTDRLHGVLFAAMTNTPCVAISAATQKIREYAEKFRDVEALFFIDRDISKLEEALGSAIEIERANYAFDFEDFDAMHKNITGKPKHEKDKENDSLFR